MDKSNQSGYIFLILYDNKINQFEINQELTDYLSFMKNSLNECFFKFFLCRKSNESILVTSQVQDYMKGQQKKGSTVPVPEVQPSNTNLKRGLEDAFNPYSNKLLSLRQ